VRPHRLDVTAFGPFAEKVEVDFDEVASGGSLVLIHGQTGGGKTTLLDAMCYALYGDTSGGERNVREMKSHHAPQDTYTEVGFEFSVRSRRYRVERKFKIGGVTYKSKVRLDVFDDETGTFRTLSTKAGEVAGQIEGILGLDKAQFRQVVVLPQGRFRDFLTAGSKEREAILASLFDTERFATMELALKEAANQVQGRLGRALERRGVALEKAGHDDVAGVRRELSELERAAADNEARAAALGSARDEAGARLAEARVVERRHAEADAARARLAALDAGAAENATKLARIDAARRARTLEADERSAQLATEDAARSEARSSSVAADLERARQLAEEARSHARDEIARDAERATLIARAEALGRSREDAKAAAAAAAALDEAKAAAKAASSAEEEARERARRASREVADVEAARARSETAAGSVAELEAAAARAGEVVRASERREALVAELASLEAAESRAAARIAEAEHEHAAAQRASRAAEERWVAGLSAELAARLDDGDECPVCGATEHPSPALHGQAGIARETLEAARREEARARTSLEEARVERTRASSERGRVQGALAEVSEAAEPVAARAARAAAEERLAIAREDAARLEERSAALARARASHEEAGEALERSAEAAARARSAAEVAEAVLDERRARLPEDTPAAPELEREIEHLEARARALEEARAAAESRAAELDARVTQLKGQREEAEAARARDAATAVSARAALERATEAAGFADPEAYGEARADVEVLERLEDEARSWTVEIETQRTRLADAEAEIGGRARPELGSLQAALAEAQSAVDDAHRELGTLKMRAVLVAELISDLERTEDEVARCRARDDVVGRLARVAGGDHPGRITFQRFVLGALLDDVLRTASSRLAQMTRGRYQLKRESEAGRRRARGLDLAVIDAYTGTERAVQTLSGGESFLAALSLALGLADAVQAQAGGLELEAIFVDEGFGGLDPEALDLAMDALARLKDSGRLVGIISHVEELKERVEARVEVQPSRVGSAVRLVC
jgi:exonuclease SbcC